MDPQIELHFFDPPIRDLPLTYVQDWFFAAYDPEAGVAKPTWAYLLPRILELLAAGQEVSYVGNEVALSRFQTGVATNWNAQEWSVIDRFQRAFLRAELREGTDYIDDTLCMFALAGWSVSDLIAQVHSVDDATLANRLWRDWCQHCVPGKEAIWITAFWDNPANSEIYDFYTSKSLRDRMATLGLAETTAPDLATRALAVAAVIEDNAAW